MLVAVAALGAVDALNASKKSAAGWTGQVGWTDWTGLGSGDLVFAGVFEAERSDRKSVV